MLLICILKANLRSAGLRAQVLNYVWTCLYRADIINLKLMSFQWTIAKALLKAGEGKEKKRLELHRGKSDLVDV